jgi:hypothetical protein
VGWTILSLARERCVGLAYRRSNPFAVLLGSIFGRVRKMTVPDETQSAPVTEPRASPWIAFRHKTFRVVWTATVVANVGTWMYNAASGWLMTSLDADPLTVSLVQVASSLPMFLFALPAGALAMPSLPTPTITSST